MPTVADLMSRTLVTTAADASLAEAASVMSRSQVGSLLVMDQGQVLGIFTERDIVRALSQDHDAASQPVDSWMTRNPKTVEPSAAADEALRLMVEGGFRHLPVIEAGRLVGMVSMRDLSGAR